MKEENKNDGPERACIHEDVISLTWLRRSMVRSKLMVGVIWGLTLLFGLGYLVLAKPVYQSKAVVFIGQIWQRGNSILLEDSGALVKRLQMKYWPLDAQQDYFFFKADLIRGRGFQDSIVEIKIHAGTKEGAERYLSYTRK